jgi:hypothetical protein
MSMIQIRSRSEAGSVPTAGEGVISLAQNMQASLARTGGLASSNTSQEQEDSSPADADFYRRTGMDLADFVQTHPDASYADLDQEIDRLAEKDDPERHLSINQKQRIAGYARQSAEGSLDALRVSYVAQNQFLLDWSDSLFKKPDDEENQW